MNVFFDLDGVIIDSNDLIVRCYAEVGVAAPPNVLACEGRPWLAELVGGEAEADAVRRRKDVLYVRRVARGEAPLLSGAHAAVALAVAGINVHLLTGAPSGVADSLREVLVPWPFQAVMGKLSQSQKFSVMRLFEGERIYVDDQPIREPQDGVRVVAYRRQSTEQLIEEICNPSYV